MGTEEGGLSTERGDSALKRGDSALRIIGKTKKDHVYLKTKWSLYLNIISFLQVFTLNVATFGRKFLNNILFQKINFATLHFYIKKLN